MESIDQSTRRARNLRTGLIVGSIALAFFLGFLIKVFSMQQ
jgi:hypothetical protein